MKKSYSDWIDGEYCHSFPERLFKVNYTAWPICQKYQREMEDCPFQYPVYVLNVRQVVYKRAMKLLRYSSISRRGKDYDKRRYKEYPRPSEGLHSDATRESREDA